MGRIAAGKWSSRKRDTIETMCGVVARLCPMVMTNGAVEKVDPIMTRKQRGSQSGLDSHGSGLVGRVGRIVPRKRGGKKVSPIVTGMWTSRKKESIITMCTVVATVGSTVLRKRNGGEIGSDIDGEAEWRGEWVRWCRKRGGRGRWFDSDGEE